MATPPQKTQTKMRRAASMLLVHQRTYMYFQEHQSRSSVLLDMIPRSTGSMALAEL